MPVSPESQALRGCTTLLRTGVDPGNIISSLYDSDLLTPEERDQANAPNLIPTQRMDVVCSALERRVRVRLEAFHKFVKILLSEPALEPVAKDLYDLYLEKGGTRQEYAAQFEAPVQPTPAPVQPTPGGAPVLMSATNPAPVNDRTDGPGGKSGPASDGSAPVVADGIHAATQGAQSPRTGKLETMEDVYFVEDILATKLERDDIQKLFNTLGLSETTVKAEYDIADIKKYAHGLIVAWRNEQDDVLMKYPAGSTWENLRKALTDIGHRGTANRLQ